MKVLDILLGSGEKIVNAKNLVTVAKQAINQMRAEESGPACDQDTFATIIDTCQCFAPVIQWISLVILATGAFLKYIQADKAADMSEGATEKTTSGRHRTALEMIGNALESANVA